MQQESFVSDELDYHKYLWIDQVDADYLRYFPELAPGDSHSQEVRFAGQQTLRDPD